MLSTGGGFTARTSISAPVSFASSIANSSASPALSEPSVANRIVFIGSPPTWARHSAGVFGIVPFHRGGVIGAAAAQMLRRTTYDRERSPCDNGPVNAEPKLDLASAGTLATESVCARLDSTPQGLTAAEAAVRLGCVRPERAAGSSGDGARASSHAQLRNPLLLLLLAAAAVSGLTGDPTDASIIAAIVALSVGLGFVNEYRAAKAVAALHREHPPRDRGVARRQCRSRSTSRTSCRATSSACASATSFPPTSGSLDVTGLECDEAVLTGESLPGREVRRLETGGDSPLDLPGCAFMGTVVHQGAGRGVVVSTGTATAFGRIAVGLGERQAETAFQVGLRGFSACWSRSPAC